MNFRAARRRVTNRLMPAFAIAAGLGSAAVLIGILVAIIGRGWASVDWGFITSAISESGASGGILYNLLGTLILMATALVVSAPLAIGVALVNAFYLPRGSRAQRALELLLHLLNGVPSILFGLVGFIVFVKFFDLGKSWLSGGILLGIMILPTVAVAFSDRIRALPSRYVEAAAGLGLTRGQIVRSVIWRQCRTGWVTGSLLGLARAIGETAPIMFTAVVFSGAGLPDGIRQSPVLALPYHIFVLAQDAFHPEVKANLWGAALVLLVLVFGLSLAALPIRLTQREEAQHA